MRLPLRLSTSILLFASVRADAFQAQPTAASYASVPAKDRYLKVSAPFAQQLLLAAKAAHLELKKIGLHVVPPGETESCIIANPVTAKIGKISSPRDLAVVRSGQSKVYPHPEEGGFFDLGLPITDADKRPIGLMVMEIPYRYAHSGDDALRIGTGIRDEISSHIPSQQALFEPVQAVSARTPHFLDPLQVPLSSLLSSPPADNSPAGYEELAQVHRAEQTRTPEQIRAAQYDDTHEDIFIYSSVLGPGFNAKTLPKTLALSEHLRNDAGLFDNPLKALYKRVRPYNFDHGLHPMCETNTEMSYPSGHAVNGYLYAFTLAEILPADHDAILKRAEDYGHNRVICGSHYPGDVEASRRVASLLFGALLVTPLFRAELDAAQAEILQQHLSSLSAPPDQP